MPSSTPQNRPTPSAPVPQYASETLSPPSPRRTVVGYSDSTTHVPPDTEVLWDMTSGFDT